MAYMVYIPSSPNLTLRVKVRKKFRNLVEKHDHLIRMFPCKKIFSNNNLIFKLNNTRMYPYYISQQTKNTLNTLLPSLNIDKNFN